MKGIVGKIVSFGAKQAQQGKSTWAVKQFAKAGRAAAKKGRR